MNETPAKESVSSASREIYLFFLYTLFSNISLGAFSLLYNLYLTQLGYQEDWIGIVNAVSTGSLALSALGLGRLLQRYGSWWCLTYGTALYLLTSLAVAFAESPATVLATVMLQGLATTFLFVPLMPFVIAYAPPRRRDTVAAIALSLTSVSATIGSFVGGWIPYLVHRLFGLASPSTLAYRSALLASIVLCALSLPPMFAMREAKTHQQRTATQRDTQRVDPNDLRRIRKYLMAFVLAGALLSLGNGAVLPFFNVFLANLGLPTRVIGLVYAGASLLGAFCGLWGPAVARRIGPLRAVTIIRLAPIPLFALLVLWQTSSLAVLAFLVRSISISMAWPLDSTLIAELLPDTQRGHAFGFRSAAWNVGFACASLLAGYTIVEYGYGPVFASYVLFCTLAVIYTASALSDHPAAQHATHQG
ncbi:MFS transporter [Thermomicrobium sp. 4228-Ro]|nr:MFS transporter [Thermomicrobium sp. 4228-Ro]